MATTDAGLEYLCHLAETSSKISSQGYTPGYTWLPSTAIQNFGHVLAEFVQKTEERKEEDTIAQGFAEAAAVPLWEQNLGAAGRELDELQILLTALEPPRLDATWASGGRRSAGSPRLRRQPTIRNVEGVPPWARGQNDVHAAAPAQAAGGDMPAGRVAHRYHARLLAQHAPHAEARCLRPAPAATTRDRGGSESEHTLKPRPALTSQLLQQCTSF